ncbi:TPA: hypothetical protein DIV55_05730 [Patescibacteria group bacterium]|uniref:Peptidase A2 domain-containing protein n=1 Tax=Candidatus Gottesmanbacteria bacterium GW2011_GWA1_43_11 TaxID=1618436 RepID=A0A0G1CJE3_9BACT|nr:MAG: hypothetical protein UV59_C0006G0060 [Candidatus Gottesmanbacteria bacterium GW2011_GWA1_43_11]HCS79208.1 hypothetical protein [Patescibacteria group bacterium]
MAVTFDFEFAGESFFGKVFRPVAQVSLHSPTLNIWTTTWMVVDSGADFSILPKYLAKDLGISLETDCTVDTTTGVGGEQTIYLVKSRIEAKIGNMIRKIPLAFFSSDEVPPLLGRLGFLETFDTEFRKSHRTVFKD